MPFTLPPPPITTEAIDKKGYFSPSVQGWLLTLYKVLGSSIYAGVAPAEAKYIVQTVHTDLTAEQSLGALSTGMMYNTVTGSTGVLSTATEGTHYYKPGGTEVTIGDGGTGASSETAARANLGAAGSGVNTDISSIQLNNTGLKVKDSDASHHLILVPGSNLTADRTLSLITGDADRNVTVTGTASISGTNTGDQTITLTGDVTGSGTGTFAASIANASLAYAKIQNVSATDKLLGRSTAGSGTIEEITCTSSGRALLDDTSASAQRTTLGFADGTYSATFTNVDNLDSTPSSVTCQYLRVGNTVTVSGSVTVDPTLPAATTKVAISLPIASDLATTEQCAGTAVSPTIAGQCAAILGDTAANRAEMQWISGDTTSQAMYFTFTYVII